MNSEPFPEEVPFKQQSQTTPVQFQEVTFLAGIRHSHLQHTGKISDIKDSFSGGACVADFDNDGWVDLLFATGGGQTRFYGEKAWWHKHQPVVLYRNIDGQFNDQTVNSGINISGSTTGCAVVDVNKDNLPDVIISSTNGSYLYRNMGLFHFKAIAEFTDIASKGWSNHISVADFNNDDLPDVYFSQFLTYSKNIKKLENATGFSEQHGRQFDAAAFDGSANQLLLNQGDFTFRDATKEFGLGLLNERSVSALPIDINNDARQDLLLFNLSNQPIRNLIQQKEGGFTENPDWKTSLSSQNSYFATIGQEIFNKEPLLVINRGQGEAKIALHNWHQPANLKDVSWELGINSNQQLFQTVWSSNQSDFNNDGFADLVFATGKIVPDNFTKKMTGAQKNQCLIANGEQTGIYQRAPCTKAVATSSRSVINLDFNNDGLQDILFVNNNDFPQLLQNVSEKNNYWLSLTIPSRLVFTGHTVELSAGSNTISRPVGHQQALFGNNDPRWHFGLGQHEEVRVNIRSPSGDILAQQKLASNNFYQFVDQSWQLLSLTTNREVSLIDSKEHRQYQEIRSVDTLVKYFATHAYGIDEHRHLLSVFANISEPERKLLAHIITTSPHAKLLPFYLFLLEQSSTVLRQAAFHAITELEQEQSSQHLLTLLANNALLACDVAQVFLTWFDEEEAVLRSKYRAIPQLLRLLESVDFIEHRAHSTNSVSAQKQATLIEQSLEHKTSNAICAAQSLAASEHPNAALALLALLEKKNNARSLKGRAATYSSPTTDDELTPALLNALGKIRQGSAILPIRQLLQNSDEVTIIQQSIIALLRLNDANLDSLITSQIGDKARGKLIFASLLTLNEANDAIVASAGQLSKWQQLAAENIVIENIDSKVMQLAYLNAQQKKLLANASVWRWLFSHDEQVKNLAISLISKLNSKTISKHRRELEQLYWSPNLTMFSSTWLFETIDYPEQRILTMLDKLSHQELLNLLPYFPRASDNYQKRMMQRLVNLPIELSLTFEQEMNLFQHCLGSFTDTFDAVEIPDLNNNIRLSLKTCQLISLVNNSTIKAIKTSFKKQYAVESVAEQQHITEKLASVVATDLLTPTKWKLISAVFFTSKQFSDSIATYWAYRNFQRDVYSTNWLVNLIKKGQPGIVRQWLTQGGYGYLSQQVDIDKLINSAKINLDEQQLLTHFLAEDTLKSQALITSVQP